MNSDQEIMVKVLFVGSAGAGKTSLLNRISDNTFQQQIICTIGCDFKIKRTQIDGRPAKFQFWDTAGQERFRTITANYYRNAEAIFLMYSVTDMNSFQEIQMWRQSFLPHINPNTPILLVGSKIDLEEQRQVPYDVGFAIAQDLQMDFIEISSKDSTNCDEAFQKLSRAAYYFKVGHMAQQIKPIQKIEQENPAKQKSGCC